MRRINGTFILLAAGLALACQDSTVPSEERPYEPYDGPLPNIVYLSTLKVQINGEWHCLRTAGDSIRLKLGTTEGFWASVDGAVPITSTEDDDLPSDNQGQKRLSSSGTAYFVFNEGEPGGFTGAGVRLDSIPSGNIGYFTFLHYDGSTQTTVPAPRSVAWVADNSGSVRFGAYNSSPVCPAL